jgi:hypothetical protein
LRRTVGPKPRVSSQRLAHQIVRRCARGFLAEVLVSTRHLIIIYAGLSRILGVKAQAKSPFVPLCERGIQNTTHLQERGLVVGLRSCGPPRHPRAD